MWQLPKYWPCVCKLSLVCAVRCLADLHYGRLGAALHSGAASGSPTSLAVSASSAIDSYSVLTLPHLCRYSLSGPQGILLWCSAALCDKGQARDGVQLSSATELVSHPVCLMLGGAAVGRHVRAASLWILLRSAQPAQRHNDWPGAASRAIAYMAYLAVSLKGLQLCMTCAVRQAHSVRMLCTMHRAVRSACAQLLQRRRADCSGTVLSAMCSRVSCSAQGMSGTMLAGGGRAVLVRHWRLRPGAHLPRATAAGPRRALLVHRVW